MRLHSKLQHWTAEEMILGGFSPYFIGVAFVFIGIFESVSYSILGKNDLVESL